MLPTCRGIAGQYHALGVGSVECRGNSQRFAAAGRNIASFFATWTVSGQNKFWQKGNISPKSSEPPTMDPALRIAATSLPFQLSALPGMKGEQSLSATWTWSALPKTHAFKLVGTSTWQRGSISPSRLLFPVQQKVVQPGETEPLYHTEMDLELLQVLGARNKGTGRGTTLALL